jgi:UDP-N-acetylglucosamine:LPS N-acetylglucosamine transferase
VLVDSALSVLLFEVMRDMIKKHQPDAIVTTYPLYQSPLLAVTSVSKLEVPVLTVVTDLVTVHRLWFNDDVDACLVPTEEVRSLALEYDIPPEKIHITGIPVHPNLSKEKRSQVEVRRELGWREDLPTFLAVGSRRVDRLMEMLNVFNHFGAPLQLAVVAGKDEELFRGAARKRMACTRPFVRIYRKYGAIDARRGCYCLQSRRVNCHRSAGNRHSPDAGGCAARTRDRQREYVVKNRAGDLVDEPILVLEALYHLLQKDARLLEERAQNARRLGRPESAYTVASMAWQAANSQRITKQNWLAERRTRVIDLLERNKIKWQISFPGSTKK